MQAMHLIVENVKLSKKVYIRLWYHSIHSKPYFNRADLGCLVVGPYI